MNIYLIGIGGSAAAYLVELARQAGHTVSGSDTTSSLVTERWQKGGVGVFIPHDAVHITPELDEVWYSAAITEQSEGFIELAEARQIGIPTLSFAEAAARFFNRAKIRVAIAGTHGKSTTTAMVGWILAKAGLDPTVAIGAQFRPWNGSARLGNPDLFVIEADEYAKRFLQFHPTHAIITNVEADHFDTYPTAEDLEASFGQFISQVEQKLVINVADARLSKLSEPFAEKRIEYGRERFDLKLIVPGEHNRQNATAAVLLAVSLGVPEQYAKQFLTDFPGVSRRFEYVGHLDQAEIYDDYGHHPTEIEATLQAARELSPDRRIVLIYQPHQAGRLRHLMMETAASLRQADHVIILPVFVVQGRENDQDVAVATSESLWEKALGLGVAAELCPTYQDAAEAARPLAKQRSTVITMGATDVWKVGQILIGEME